MPPVVIYGFGNELFLPKVAREVLLLKCDLVQFNYFLAEKHFCALLGISDIYIQAKWCEYTQFCGPRILKWHHRTTTSTGLAITLHFESHFSLLMPCHVLNEWDSLNQFFSKKGTDKFLRRSWFHSKKPGASMVSFLKGKIQ